MIRKLRWKFILVAMASMILILGIIVGTIGLVNYNGVTSDADRILNVLVNNEGTFGKDEPPAKKDDTSNGGGNSSDSNQTDDGIATLSDDSDAEDTTDNNTNPGSNQEGTGQNPPPDDSHGHENDFGGNQETPFSTRYFSVILTLDSNGDVTGDPTVDTSRIAAIDSDEALSMGLEVFHSDKLNDYDGVYRYLGKNYEKDGTPSFIVVFVDCTNSLESVRTFAINAIWISACGIVAVFVVVTLLSYLVFAPVKKSYDKQKVFVTNAAHELKTPLTIISANNELIEAQYDATDETQAIDKQVKKLAHMINNLTLLSKLDEKDGKLDSNETIDLTKMGNELVDSFESVLLVKNVKFDHAIEEDVSMHGNGTMISQLLTLLMDNACKYALTYINFNIRKDGKYVVIESMNDAQIDEQNPEMLLERFYRSDKARAGTIEGSGIGLSIVKEIVNLHRGTIRISAQNNTYSCSIRIKA